MPGFLVRLLPYALAFSSSLCIMIIELVSSRLVARHVGSSLTVWTSVIGIILGGICLGNVLGGRLADRVDPRKAVGPLFAIGALLTLSTLWVNAKLDLLIPRPDALNWELRTILVVTLDFLIPATVLGMIGPVVAKMAVEQARRAGSAIGDVYFVGAIGSIVGTFICGFYLMYYLSTSTIVLVVAAAISLLAAGLMSAIMARLAAAATAACLALASIPGIVDKLELGGLDLGSYKLNGLALVGNGLACVLGLFGVAGLLTARRAPEDSAGKSPAKNEPAAGEARPGLADLAVLAFVASLVFMSLEMVAGRLVQRHLGSSIYGWTSVIGILLAGLSLGNFLGGKIADFIKKESQASWLFLAASVLILGVIFLETQPPWLRNVFLAGDSPSVLSHAITMSAIKIPAFLHLPWQSIPLTWPFRILVVTTIVFFLPALTLGTVSPVVAKLAVDRLKRHHRTGTAIGQVYAWGMVGSILGTFLTGFFLIDVLGTKGVILILATVMGFGATLLGSVWHALWAGIPLGLCVIAFTPITTIEKIGLSWGVREEAGDPTKADADYSWIDESNYYYIKVNNETEQGGEITRRTLVLDNLIHGYFILDHPERLDYDYEHIYALVAYRAARASGKVTFKPAAEEPTPTKLPQQPFAPPAASQPAGEKTGLKSVAAAEQDAPKGDAGAKPSPPAAAKPQAPPAESKPAPPTQAKPAPKGAAGPPQTAKDVPGKPDANTPPPVRGDIPLMRDEEEEEPRGSSLPNAQESKMTTLFLGGGAYCFQRHMQKAYPGTAVDVAEIDPAVTRANHKATGLPMDTPIKTYWGDARQFVELNQDSKQYDLVFGDAFNDFSVPWHLTTREFNEKIKKMMSPNGVYMINIIDVYLSDQEAEKRANRKIESGKVVDPAKKATLRELELAEAHRYGGFVGAWTKTAKETWDHIYIFGTDDDPGSGLRETFVVVASMKPLDLADLGARPDDPKFYHRRRRVEPKPYGPYDLEQVDARSRGIILTDDYAPVENLLAPVAETRAND